ncbi:hypothetical protein CoNPh17_CDS0004 [Staphylococcus phage S-CoN_Ph17]|nr:hypothetical protein CoNPh17_CDS0004 [Staphylococcus phage S-CoN_Ph17]
MAFYPQNKNLIFTRLCKAISVDVSGLILPKFFIFISYNYEGVGFLPKLLSNFVSHRGVIFTDFKNFFLMTEYYKKGHNITFY